MTRYERGFLTKCAEHGLNADQAIALLKMGGNDDVTLVSPVTMGEKMDAESDIARRVGVPTMKYDPGSPRMAAVTGAGEAKPLPERVMSRLPGRGSVVGTRERTVSRRYAEGLGAKPTARPASTGRRMLTGAFPFLSSAPFGRPSTYAMPGSPSAAGR